MTNERQALNRQLAQMLKGGVRVEFYSRLLKLLLKGPLFWSKNPLTIDHQPDPASETILETVL